MALSERELKPDWLIEVGGKALDSDVDMPPDRWEGFQPKPSRAKRYLDGKLAFELRLRLRCGTLNQNVRDLHAIFERTPEADWIDDKLKLGRYWLAAEAPAKLLDIGEDAEGGVDCPVLIGIHVFVNGGKSENGLVCASRVRLKVLDDRGVLVSDATYPLYPHRLEAAFRVKEGEADGLALTRRTPSQEDQLIDEVVERRTPVGQYVAEDQPEAKGWVLAHSETRNVNTVRASLVDDAIGITLGELQSFGVEFFEMLVRPVELGAGIVERRFQDGANLGVDGRSQGRAA